MVQAVVAAILLLNALLIYLPETGIEGAYTYLSAINLILL
jgi:hypothetical protein